MQRISVPPSTTVPPLSTYLVAIALLLSNPGCSGDIEVQADAEGTLGVDAAVAGEHSRGFATSPLSAGAGEELRCGSVGVKVGRIPVTSEVLQEVSAYQSVEVPLSGAAELKVELVSGRDTLFRAFVDPSHQRPDGARLVIREPGEESWTFEQQRVLGHASEAGRLASTYNFQIAGKYITPSSEVSLELFRNVPCELVETPKSAARFPGDGFHALGAREVGALTLVLVPIRYWADDSGREPDFSPARVEELRSFLDAMYPVPNVELRVHEPVDTEESSLEAVLSQVMHLRAAERPAPHVGYFGLVNPADSMDDYCKGSCVAGVSAVGSASGHSSSGVGVGFRDSAAETLLHELGHMHRLDHAPCGSPSGVDTEFPHEDARLGAWGYDKRGHRLIDPDGAARDFMSYCDPAWISDVNTQRLIERIALSNSLL